MQGGVEGGVEGGVQGGVQGGSAPHKVETLERSWGSEGALGACGLEPATLAPTWGPSDP